ncbi:MAG: orotidine-5'-phosphate decarboxylase [Flavobacteriaceae bacterium]|nr:orotidine-5'-phosphate decarboxylase [Flavobacteriaceae bacterium]
MTRSDLIEQIQLKNSLLCVGLDSDINRIPLSLIANEDPVFEFNKAIIDATHSYCVSFKINMAFYESRGVEGWQSLEKTIDYINENYPKHFTIADAKRGDIGNTADQYAKAFFEAMDFDAVTVAPYMGRDSVLPFLKYTNKFTIVLGITSNDSASDFQMHGEETPLYKEVLLKTATYPFAERLMYVVGATKADALSEIREILPNHFLLIPGVGAQGGSLKEVLHQGLIKDYGLLINSSRGIIFASEGNDFALKAKEAAADLQKQMSTLLQESI